MLALFLDSAWKVVVAGLLLGAGLPMLFAVGVRQSVLAQGPSGPAPLRRGLAAAAYVVVVAAMAVGLLVIIAGGVGKAVSFEHVVPTLVDKG